ALAVGLGGGKLRVHRNGAGTVRAEGPRYGVARPIGTCRVADHGDGVGRREELVDERGFIHFRTSGGREKGLVAHPHRRIIARTCHPVRRSCGPRPRSAASASGSDSTSVIAISASRQRLAGERTAAPAPSPARRRLAGCAPTSLPRLDG